MPVETDFQDCRLRCRPMFVAKTGDETAFQPRLIWTWTQRGQSGGALSGLKAPS